MMTKTLTQSAKQKPEAAVTRSYDADEFKADTTEDRPVALLAQRRRQFLAEMTQHTNDNASES